MRDPDNSFRYFDKVTGIAYLNSIPPNGWDVREPYLSIACDSCNKHSKEFKEKVEEKKREYKYQQYLKKCNCKGV